MTLITDVIPKLWTPNDVVRSMSKKWHLRGPFQKQHGKRVQTLLKSERQHLSQNYWSLSGELSCRKSLYVIWKILSLLVNTVTADDKYSVLYRDNSTQPIQMHLCQKQNIFSEFFSQRVKSSLTFEHFWKKDDPKSWCLSENAITSKTKIFFRTFFTSSEI